MIAGIFHRGSGLGNQLARYVMTRVVAMDKGLDWGMISPENFKGLSFLDVDMGLPVECIDYEYFEKRINNENGVDIRGYDWGGLLGIKDNTVIDGEFQGEKYYEHHRAKIDSWLHVEPVFEMPDNLCIIGFRAGEYQTVPDLFLTQKYWDDAIANMLKENPKMRFEVVTEDPVVARGFFPDLKITSEIGDSWRKVRYAKYLIIANSSFYILPTWLNSDLIKVIAPLYWARHNVSNGWWALEQNKMKGWDYQDRDGNLTRI